MAHIHSKVAHIYKLDKYVLNTSTDPKSVVIVSDASIKNNIAIFITHIHSHSNLITKTIYYTVNITSMLWQPPIIMTSRYTQSIKLSVGYQVVGNYKRTQQEVSAKLPSYLYSLYMVCTTNNYSCPNIHTSSSCLPYILLKAIMLHSCALILSSRSFYHVLGLWCHIMWHVMWLQCHMPLHRPNSKNKTKQN